MSSTNVNVPFSLISFAAFRECADGDTRERRAEADSLCARRDEICDGKILSLDTCENVHRLRSDCRADRLDCGETWQTWRVKHVSAGCCESLQAANGIVEIGAAV